MARTGLSFGLNKGHVVTKPAAHPRNSRPAHKKGRLHKRVKMVREVIKEITGLAPYEKVMVEMIKTGVPAREKKAVKLAKRRLGTHKRSQAKRNELVNYVQAQRKRQQ